jgi:hypothetical protein
MNHLSAFKTLDESLKLIIAKKSVFVFPLIVFILSNVTSPLWKFSTGVSEDEMLSFVGNIISLILALWAFVIVIYDVIDLKVHNRSVSLSERATRALWDTPTYGVYSIVLAIFVIVGLLLFILPGLYALWAFTFAPILAVLSNQSGQKHFSNSRELAKKSGVFCAKVIGLVVLSQTFPPILRGIIEGGLPFLNISFFLLVGEAIITLWGEVFLVLALLKLKD